MGINGHSRVEKIDSLSAAELAGDMTGGRETRLS